MNLLQSQFISCHVCIYLCPVVLLSWILAIQSKDDCILMNLFAYVCTIASLEIPNLLEIYDAHYSVRLLCKRDIYTFSCKNATRHISTRMFSPSHMKSSESSVMPCHMLHLFGHTRRSRFFPIRKLVNIFFLFRFFQVKQVCITAEEN